MKQVFDRDVMSQYLSSEDVNALFSSEQLSDLVRQRFADALLRWAFDNGVTRYCHWFQPLTGGSAGKLDTFVNYDLSGDSLLNVQSSRTSSVAVNNGCTSCHRHSSSDMSRDSSLTEKCDACKGSSDLPVYSRQSSAHRCSDCANSAKRCSKCANQSSSSSNTVLRFPASSLLRGEADASSFPSGTARHTHEARGYTLWDADSQIFIRDGTLHIPAVFCTPDGSALDDRTPLLRSIEYLKSQVKNLLNKFGVKSNNVEVNLGVEQEFFLIPIQKFRSRLDLISCGCTLFGSAPPKTQQLQDQYFGVLKENVRSFLDDVNKRLEQLGIHVKTEHNEVAPAQHEVVVLYSSAEKATDQNMLVMETLKGAATAHGLACLLHEKPFFGINGSGKHCNWSISVDGVQLLSLPEQNIPKNTAESLQKQLIAAATSSDADCNQVLAIPGASSSASSNGTQDSQQTIQNQAGRAELTREVFLTIFTAVLVAVRRHADLLLVSAACAGNQRRLGGHEAPPAVISVFTGKPMEKLLRRVQTSTPNSPVIEMNVSGIQNTKIEASDRNRTSPFAFTGNKFEFRMPGSAQNVSFVNTVLNTIVGSVLAEIADHVSRVSPADIPNQIVDILQPYINEAIDIIFNGDGYSQEWKDEMFTRGLYREDDICKLYDRLLQQDNIDLFTQARVMTIKELEIKHSVLIDRYRAQLQIELDCLLQMSKKYITGFAIRQLQFNNELISGLSSEIVPESVSQYRENVTKYLSRLSDFERLLKDKPMTNIKKVIQARDALVSSINILEQQTDKSIWSIPDYSDILFYNAE